MYTSTIQWDKLAMHILKIVVKNGYQYQTTRLTNKVGKKNYESNDNAMNTIFGGFIASKFGKVCNMR